MQDSNTMVKTKRGYNKKEIVFVLLCTIPTIILFAIFVIFPIFNMLITSFQKWTGSISAVREWVGFSNYGILFQSANFWNAFKNTIFLIIFVTAVTLVLAITFAAMLSKGKTKGKAFFRIVFYIPNILSIVVISAIFSAILSPGGVMANIYNLFGGEYKPWLSNESSVMWAIGTAMIWQAVGYYMVMYVAGMDSIPEELYEAADLDGATKSRQFFVITIPLTWQIIRITFTFFIISTINMSFLFVDAMTRGSAKSHVLLTYMYEQTFTNSTYGYGMAISAVIFIFAYALSLIIQSLTNRQKA